MLGCFAPFFSLYPLSFSTGTAGCQLGWTDGMASFPVMQFGAANFGHVVLPAALPSAKRDDDDSCELDKDEASTVATRVATESAFANAKSCAPDPILGIRDDFLKDPAEHKLNLAVGVYRTAEGKPLVLECVKAAEAHLLEEQRAGRTFKEYLPPEGMTKFCDLSLRLLLGDAITPALEQGRVVAAQSISGTGGLHLAARMLQILRPGSTVHLPTPTWPIHPDIFTAVGLAVAYYPYYDARTGGLDFDGMLAALQALPAGSVVLLHACAHNPTGVDPTAAQWARIAQAVARPLIPLVDAAYQAGTPLPPPAPSPRPHTLSLYPAAHTTLTHTTLTRTTLTCTTPTILMRRASRLATSMPTLRAPVPSRPCQASRDDRHHSTCHAHAMQAPCTRHAHAMHLHRARRRDDHGAELL